MIQGVAPSGPGLQAATGFAISASVNVSERPVTGQGMMGMKTQSHNAGRIVFDAAYYVGLLRKKISDVNSEYIKLRNEIDRQSKDNSQYVQLERKYDTLSKNKEALEGQLADYNLALDKVKYFTLISMIVFDLLRLEHQLIPKMFSRWQFICRRRINRQVKS